MGQWLYWLAVTYATLAAWASDTPSSIAGGLIGEQAASFVLPTCPATYLVFVQAPSKFSAPTYCWVTLGTSG